MWSAIAPEYLEWYRKQWGMESRGETGWEILPTGTSMGGRVGL